MSKVILKLMGGLGNQMFQYASARALAKNGVILDLSFLAQKQIASDHFTVRDYELGIFANLKIRKIPNLILKLRLSNRKILSLIKVLPFLGGRKLLQVNDENIINLKENELDLYLIGYFQSPLYFRDIRISLLKEFEFPKVPKNMDWVEEKLKTSKNTIALHIRRGDYLKTTNIEIHGLLSVSYYKEAVQFIEKKIQKPNYFIFSDDPKWCEENIAFVTGSNFKVISGSYPSWVDMYLMSLCEHQIIANSSFSWWAAWLNSNENKIVCAPKNWFADPIKNLETKTLIPSEWIKI